MGGWEKRGIRRLRQAQVFLGFFVSGIAPQRFSELDHGLRNLALGQVQSAQIVVDNCLLRISPNCRKVISLRLLQISFREKSIREAKLPLADFIVEDFAGFDPAHPDAPESFHLPASPARSDVGPRGN